MAVERHREVEGHDPCGAPAGRQPRAGVVRHHGGRLRGRLAAAGRLHRPRSEVRLGVEALFPPISDFFSFNDFFDFVRCLRVAGGFFFLITCTSPFSVTLSLKDYARYLNRILTLSFRVKNCKLGLRWRGT